MRSESRNPLHDRDDPARRAGRSAPRRLRRADDAAGGQGIGAEQLCEMEDWAFEILEALNAGQQLDMLRLLGPKYDIDPEMTTKMALAMPNFADFNSLIYMHTVIPNLKSLGLITERTEDRWRKVGMMTDKRTDAQMDLTLAN